MAIITSLKKFGHMFGPMWVPHVSSASGDVETANNTNREEPNVESVVREIAARRSLPCPNPRITSLTSVAPSSANIRAVGTAKRGSVPGGSYSSMITASPYVPPKRGNLGSMARSPMTSSSTLYGSSQHSLAGIREEGTTSSKGEYMEDTRKDEKTRGGWIKRLLKLHSRGKEKEMANIAPPVSSESLASISENVVCDGKPSRKNRANDSWWSFRTKGRVAGSAQTLCEPDPDSATPAPIGPDLTSAIPIEPMAKREEKASAKRLSISKKDCSADLAKDHVGESNEKTFENPPNPQPVASHSQAGNKWFAALVAKNNKKLRKEVLQSNLLPPEELICHTTEETGGRPEYTQWSATAERKLKSEGYRDKQDGSEKKTIEKRERDESKLEANVTQSMEHSEVADQKQIEERDLDDTEVKSTTKSNTPSSIETESSYAEPTGLYRSVATNLNDSGHRNSDRSSQTSSVGEQTGVELNEDEVESEAKIREIRLRIAEQYSSGQRKLPFNFRYKYYLLDMLGDGAFGFVMVARRRDGKCNEESQKIQEYAVKFIARGKVSSHLWVDDEALGKIPFEAHILGHLNHPNIVKLVDIYNEDKEYVLMVTEMHGTQWDGVNPLLNASNNPNLRRSSAPVRSLPPPATNSDSIPGHHLMRRRTSCDLFECIDAHTYMAESVGRKIFAQIVEAIYYLNSVGLVHRDLKDENIVIDEHYNVKLIDFGSANCIPTHPADYFYTFNGTINYASPEICRGNPYRGPEAEVWALGVLLYTIVAGQNPFAGPEEIIKGHQNDFPRATRLCADLLRRTLHADPLQRATIQEVRDHPWLAPEGYGDF